jgi:hypothetical protein
MPLTRQHWRGSSRSGWWRDGLLTKKHSPRSPDVRDVPKLAIEQIMASSLPAVTGRTTSSVGLGCNLLDDAVYPTALTDVAGGKFDGANNKYIIRFPNGQMPPAGGFWSITMYNAEYFFVANSLNRYTLSARNALKSDADGTVTLRVTKKLPMRALIQVNAIGSANTLRSFTPGA